MKTTILKLLPLILLGFPFNSYAAEQILQLISDFNLGNNGFYNRVLSPAKTADVNKSESDRTSAANKRIQHELLTVISVFDKSTEDNKEKNVRDAFSLYDKSLLVKGTNIIFADTQPSTAATRTLILIKKDGRNTQIDAKNLLKTFTSYKRSAAPSTYVYEYSDAKNISQSRIKTTVGNDLSWKKDQAAPEMPNDDLVLKKCRQIFGWKCVTSLYRTGEMVLNNKKTQYLIAGVYDLKNNPDHPEFSKDKRSFNQIDGSTAIYLVRESADWVMLIGIDAQWNEEKPSFITLVMDEVQKDFLRIKERIAEDLKIKTSDIK